MIETIAQNTSIGFFTKMGFALLPGQNGEYQLLSKHVITVVRM